MTEIIDRHYCAGDLAYVDSYRLRELAAEERWTFEQNLNGPLNSWTWTLVDETGRIYGVIGIIPQRAGTAEVWSILNDEALAMPGAPRAVRFALWREVRRRGLFRAFATCTVRDYPSLQRWFRFLGLAYEGIVRGYGPNGADQHIFAWVREEARDGD